MSDRTADPQMTLPWFRVTPSRKRYRLVALIIAMTVALTLAASGCSIAEVSYQPPLVPLIFAVDGSGNISVRAEASIVTFVGKFAVSSNVYSSLERDKDTTLVVIRHSQDGVSFDSVFRLATESELVAKIDGRTEIRIADHRIFIDAGRGKVEKIEIVPAAPAVPQSPPRTTSTRGADSGEVLLADSLMSSVPNGLPTGCDRQRDGIHNTGGSCSLAKLPTGPVDVSVTIEWRSNRPDDQAGLGLSQGSSSLLYSIEPGGGWKLRSISGDTLAEGRSRAIRERLNRVTLRLRAQNVEFLVNESRLDSVAIPDYAPDADSYIQLYSSTDGGHLSVFTDFITRRS